MSAHVNPHRPRAWPLLLIAALLGACAAPPPRGPSPPGPDARPAAEPAVVTDATPPSMQRYAIVPGDSLVEIRVFRAGAMARLGHNHVIAARDIEGEVALAAGSALASGSGSRAGTSVDLRGAVVRARLPVGAFTVDEPELRVAAGADFAAEVPESARDGTRRNMLGSALLDAERFPAIELSSIAIMPGSDPAELSLQLRVRVAGHESTIAVPARVERTPQRLVASGRLRLRQSALGLTPFSVMMGALQVQDEMDLVYRISAAAAAP